jgi:hypothetical protein
MLHSINFEDLIYFNTNKVNTKAILTNIEKIFFYLEFEKWIQSL